MWVLRSLRSSKKSPNSRRLLKAFVCTKQQLLASVGLRKGFYDFVHSTRVECPATIHRNSEVTLFSVIARWRPPCRTPGDLAPFCSNLHTALSPSRAHFHLIVVKLTTSLLLYLPTNLPFCCFCFFLLSAF